MPQVVNQEWGFGNGLYSTSSNPVATYTTGNYTVILNATLDSGEQVEVEKEIYVSVSEDGKTQDKEGYIRNPFSIHYGWNNDMGMGWSINNRVTMPTPVSNSSTFNYEENGVMYSVVWDFLDGKPYIYEPHTDFNLGAPYRDKVMFDGEVYDYDTGYDIDTEIITPEFTGSMLKFRLKHIESNTLFRPMIGYEDYMDNFAVNFGLLVEGNEDPVETEQKVSYNNEVSFYYQSCNHPLSRTRALKITTDTSRYQMMNYEGFFKRIDEYTALAIEPSYSMDAQAVFTNLCNWITIKGNYAKDLATKADSGLIGELYSADNWALPFGGFEITEQSSITIAESSVIAMWVKDDTGYFEGEGFSEYDRKDNGDGTWTKLLKKGPEGVSGGDTIVFPVGVVVGDIRAITESVENKHLFEYFTKTRDYVLC